MLLPTVSDPAMEEEPMPSRKHPTRGWYPCPCCGYRTLPVPQEEAVAYICPVCFWENDVFLQSETEPSVENHGMTLAEARANFRRLGACCEQMLPYVRKAFPGEEVD